LKASDPLPAPLTDQFRDADGWLVDDGITQLKKAITARRDYPDAWGYLNLLYRQKADLCADAEERERYIQLADELVRQIVQAREHPSGPVAVPRQ
jgi:hypothetical protein